MFSLLKKSKSERDLTFRNRVIYRSSIFIGGLMALAMIIRSVFFEMKPVAIVVNSSLIAVVILVSRLVKNPKYTDAGGWIILVSCFLIATVAGITNGGVRAPVTVLLILQPIFGLLMLDRPGGFWGLFLSVSGTALLTTLEKLGMVLPLDKGATGYISVILALGAVATYFFAMIFDKTRRQAESDLLRVTQQLAVSSKLSSMGQMASAVGHEINNPLAIILGRVHHLLDDSVSPAELKDGLQKIEEQAKRISQIIKGLKAVSRGTRNDPIAPIEISGIVEDVKNICSERFRIHGISLSILPAPSAKISCRPHQISQILINLLNNSFDAVENTKDAWVKVDFHLRKDQIEVRVMDSGQQIPDQIAAHLMDPFFTTKEIGKGTGLGLSISRTLAEENGGELFLDRTRPNTCFVLRMPIS